jgi:[DsrC]-trisulfide reductase subunit O
MEFNRRDFLRIAGLSAAAGVVSGQTHEAAAAKLPQESPITGKRWAMVVDLKKCQHEKGCHKCSDACHGVHNVPDFSSNPKHEVKWIWKESFAHALTEHTHQYMGEELKHAKLPVLCNHCENPPCTRVCPTKATWKRTQDGIVMMDWHRCIGCRYCIAACPYGSRSFNWKNPREGIEKISSEFPTRSTGVVEKCTFCEERLAKGQMPACVEACDKGALVFGDLSDPDSEVRKLLREKFTVRRKPGLGTQPQVYYII